MSGLLSGLLGSNDQTVTTRSDALRPQAEALASSFFTNTQNFANQPYQPYGGERTAGFTPDQYAAFEAARRVGGQAGDIYGQMAGLAGNSTMPGNITSLQGLAGGISGLAAGSQNYLPGMQTAADRTGAIAGLAPGLLDQSMSGTLGLAQTFPGVDIQAYMNPYLQQVLDPAMEDIARRADIDRNALRSQQARTGAFGGSRGAIAEQELERNVMGEMGRLSGTERARAFNEASNQFRLDQQRIPELYRNAFEQAGAAQGLQRGALDAANQALLGRSNVIGQGLSAQQGYGNVSAAEMQRMAMLQGLSGANQNLLQSQVNPLLATGGLQQALSQSQLDTGYQNYLEGRDWATRGLSAQRAALGLPGSVTGTGVQTTNVNPPNANPYGQVIGGTLGVLSALGSPTVKSGLSGIGNVVSGAGSWIGEQLGFGGSSDAFSGFSSGGGLASTGSSGLSSWLS